MAKLFLGLSAAVGGGLIWACTTGGEGGFAELGQTGGASSVFSGGTSSGSSGVKVPATGTTANPDGGVQSRRPKACDENGENCRCINLASFGGRALSAYGVGSDGQQSSTTAFDTWLTEKSNATVTMVLEKPGSITLDYLNGFDVILLQDLRNWSFGNDELKALEQWVNEGGGLIALNGYMNNDDQEVDATNKVLAFTGMSYHGGSHDGSVPMDVCPESSRQFCPQSPEQNCCYCWNNTIPVTDWDTSHPVADPASGFKAVGALMGRSINESDAQVVATYEGKTVAASKSIGVGKAFLWCDEWVTYTSQWKGGQVQDVIEEQLQYQRCYDLTAGHWLTADQVFQTKQFWYNVIHYVSPPTECDFVIDEPEVKIYNI